MFSVVILAGGKGERFWPESRSKRPKQFLPLTADKVMLRQTIDRVVPAIAPIDRVYIVTEASYASLVSAIAPELPAGNLLLEPVGRNTAPGIGWAAHHLAAIGRSAEVMVVLPADHSVGNEAMFNSVIHAAVHRAAETNELVTLGIKPDRPETGYGYIALGEKLTEVGGYPCHRVVRFVEKPPLAQAEAMCNSGLYLWNSGMFIWRVDAILGAIERTLPEICAGLRDIKPVHSDNGASLAEIYPRLAAISIDYGVMEKSTNITVFPCDISWDDVGSWSALARLLPVDNAGNLTAGKHVGLRTSNSIVINRTDQIVTTLGVADAIIIAVDGVVMVCPLDEAPNVRDMVNELRRQGLCEYI